MIVDIKWLDDFFGKHDADNILKRRESTSIEFKRELNWCDSNFRSKLSKTVVAFANTRGGIVFFGIDDTPHKIIGVTNWEEFDHENLSVFLNKHYSPSIYYETMNYQFEGKSIGVLIVFVIREN